MVSPTSKYIYMYFHMVNAINTVTEEQIVWWDQKGTHDQLVNVTHLIISNIQYMVIIP